MNTSLILRAALLGLVVIGTMAGWNAVENENDGVKLMYFIFVGAGVGIWVIRVVLPRLGDAVGAFIYSSGEEVEPEDLNDPQRAGQVLEGVMTDFPNTGDSATARPGLHELEQPSLGQGRSGEGIEGARVDPI